MRTIPSLALVASLAACRDPAAGTFVGNPTMSARMAEPAQVDVSDGELVALEMLLGDCDQVGDVPLGSRTFTFDGAQSRETLQIPADEYCGVFLVVDLMRVVVDDGEGERELIADDFDLWVPTSFLAEANGRFRLRFGDEDWLREVVTLTDPGTYAVNGEATLSTAFYAGLDRSVVEELPPASSSRSALLPPDPE